MTQIVSVNPKSKTVFEYPTKAMRDEYKKKGVTPYITGFDNSLKDGTGNDMNLILSNGARSVQRDGNGKYYTHMMPEGCHNKIRSVSIHYNSNCIRGFSFFDKEGALLWKIGLIGLSWMTVETVLIGENERIVGVVAKLF